jgi:hypothetical protein
MIRARCEGRTLALSTAPHWLSSAVAAADLSYCGGRPPTEGWHVVLLLREATSCGAMKANDRGFWGGGLCGGLIEDSDVRLLVCCVAAGNTDGTRCTFFS